MSVQLRYHNPNPRRFQACCTATGIELCLGGARAAIAASLGRVIASCFSHLAMRAAQHQVMAGPNTTLSTSTLVLTVGYGNAPFLWRSGVNVCNASFWDASFPMSEALWRQFAD